MNVNSKQKKECELIWTIDEILYVYKKMGDKKIAEWFKQAAIDAMANNDAVVTKSNKCAKIVSD